MTLICSPVQAWMAAITKKAESSDSIKRNSRVNPSVPTKSIHAPEHQFLRNHENKLYLAKPRTDYLKRSFSIVVLSFGITLQRR